MGQFEQGQSGNPATQFKSGQEAEEFGRKGGVASGIAKRKKKAIKTALLALMDAEHVSRQGLKADGYEIYAADLWNLANSPKEKPETRLKAKKLLAELLGEYKQQVELGSDGRPFEIHVVKTTDDMKDKINDYLNGSGLDGQSL